MGVSGLVLAGGQGRRMGGVDKGLQLYRDRPLAEHVIERFRPQVEELLISAAAGAKDYERFGCRLVMDRFRDAGPLAGLHAGLVACAHPLLASAPCDVPHLPLDLVARLRTGLEEADAAVARAGERLHPVFAILRRELAPRLETFLNSGGRSVEAWYATLNTAEVLFIDPPEAFANLNTMDELRRLESE